jgi:hypothetical protein
MRNYRPSAATPVRVDYGAELVAGLRLFPETQVYAAPLEALNDQLDAAYEDRRRKRRPLVAARAALRFAGYQIDQVIRSAARAAEIGDGGRRGPIFGAVFPDGVRSVVLPSGARQIPPARALIDRINKSKAAGIDAYRAEWQPKLSAALEGLEASSIAYSAAASEHRDAFTTELSLREQHIHMIDQTMGHVRAAFPRDNDRQNLVFPIVDDDRSTARDEDDEPPESKSA